MAKLPLVCLVTGPLAGLRSRWFIKDAVAHAAALGLKIETFDVLATMLGADPKPAAPGERQQRLGELVNGMDFDFETKRKAAYWQISSAIARLGPCDGVIVRAPATLDWRGVILDFKDHNVIAEALRPHRIVTLIDAEWKIRERLQSEYNAKTLAHMVGQTEFDLTRILRWVGAEVSRSEDWAQACSRLTGVDVDHIVLGVETPSARDRSVYARDVDGLVKAAVYEDLTTIYASYSMTIADDRGRDAVHDAVWRLRRYGLVIDPAAIELPLDAGGDYRDETERDTVHAYTLCRDLRWDVKKVDMIAAIHPYGGPDRPNELPPLSTGMLDELEHAKGYGKERYFVLPTGTGSPFTDGGIVPKGHVFADVDALLKHLEEQRAPSLKPRFDASVDRLLAKRRAKRSS